MEEVTEWRYRRRGTQLSLAEIRDDGPAEPSRYSATTPPPCRPCREPQSALAPSALNIESEARRSAVASRLGRLTGLGGAAAWPCGGPSWCCPEQTDRGCKGNPCRLAPFPLAAPVISTARTSRSSTGSRPETSAAWLDSALEGGG